MIKQTCLALLALTSLAAGPASASYDVFLKVDGINGTSDVRGFEDYIELYSFSLGFTRGICSAMTIMKSLDNASAAMTGAALLGTTYPSAVLALLKPGEQPFVFMKLTLGNLVFTSLQQSGASDTGSLPTETVTLQPSSVRMEAFEQDERGNAVLVATSSVTCQKPK